MKDLLSTLSLILLVCFVIGLFFIFTGSPDLWDVAHEHAMTYFKGLL